MAENELLDYLKNYVRDPEILTSANISLDLRASLPDAWMDLLDLDKEERVHAALMHWQPFQSEFQQVIAYFRANLVSIDLITSSRGPGMLYGVRAQTGSTMYYEGKPPVAVNPNSAIAELWSKTPDSLQKFYRELHNGWYYFASESMGLSSLDRIFVLSREDWGILDELEQVPVDLNRSLAVFTNGMGGYVCLQLLDNDVKTFLWFHNKAPRLNLDLWPLIDSWTLIGFEG
jgi:hypothetical protein